VFPLWWAQVPFLLNPPKRVEGEEEEPIFAPRRFKSAATTNTGSPTSEPVTVTARHVTIDQHWLRLGYICTALFLVARWIYIASGTIQLAEDEAYQWLWSKHLALSYFSKPPLIAYAQFLGTTLWGDTAFGIRFFSPLVTAFMSVLVLRFFAREVNARAGFFLLLIVSATPLLSVGAVLMTVDPLSVLFWMAAMLAGWRAVQEKGTTVDWLWVGLWMGLGFLSKYTQLFQLLCWAVFMVLWPPARRQLRRPGPYLALLVNLLCALPVLVWNAQHSWITVHHVAVDADVGQPWRRTFIGDFLGSEAGLLNPVFFVAMVWACIGFWRRARHNPLLVYCFSMGAPLFLSYMLHSLHARVLPNWIAPSVLPLFCVMVIYWDTRLRLGVSQVKTWLGVGLTFGFLAVFFFHATELWSRTFGLRQVIATAAGISPDEKLWNQFLTEQYLPVKLDPLHRVRNWSQTAQAVEGIRRTLLAEGKPVFIIADHYGLTGQISFYLPEARTNVREAPLVFCRRTDFPENQFYFWPGYESRKGQNALYVRELDRDNPLPQPPPKRVEDEFESVTDMGVTNVLYHDRFLLRPLQIFVCRGLR
jgi:4-amino-4-deoxy-L-arabinose transferase-like glycosyltransferase